MIVAQDFEVGKSFVLNVRTSSEVRVMKFINVIEVIKLAVYSSLNDRYLDDCIKFVLRNYIQLSI
jgi:hypothetical protein